MTGKGLLMLLFAASVCVWGLYKVVLRYGVLGLVTGGFVVLSVVGLFLMLVWSKKYEVKG